jgi:hypothetical protein
MWGRDGKEAPDEEVRSQESAGRRQKSFNTEATERLSVLRGQRSLNREVTERLSVLRVKALAARSTSSNGNLRR